MYSVEHSSIQLSVILFHWIASADRLVGLALTILIITIRVRTRIQIPALTVGSPPPPLHDSEGCHCQKYYYTLRLLK